MKGIILAGGKGTRLRPATLVMNKHLIPILNKPMVLYPIETLRDVFGIKDILIVSGGDHIGGFAEFLGDGSEYGVELTYRVQTQAGGIAQALALAENFAQGESIAVILGDNIFDAKALKKSSKNLKKSNNATLFLKEVPDAERFGVPTLNQKGKIVKITEKPQKPDSSYAVTGLYLYPGDVFKKVKKLKPSARGELEITDVNQMYVQEGKCNDIIFDGFWSDAGTPASLARTVLWAAEQSDIGTADDSSYLRLSP
ncbi:spore coat protein [bacterium]|nr:spore coat protein [bacterium]